ncbi:hypothetical protein GCM10009086_25210 [Pseudomonas rhodesiae]
MAQAAFRLQRFDQLFERQVLMCLGFQGRLLDLLEQLDKRQLAADVGLEDLSVDKKTDQTLGFHPVTVGNRHAHANIRLAGIAIQQCLERSQQHHKQRRALPLGQALQSLQQRGVQQPFHTRTAVALRRGAGMIERQVQHPLLAGQTLTPIGQLARLLTGLQPVALPHRIVGILNRQRWQLRFQALLKRGIGLHQLLDHHLHRPGIADDVMQHQDEHMLIRCQLQQPDAQQRPSAQIERFGDCRLDLGPHHGRIISSEGLLFDPQRRWRSHPLHGALTLRDKHRAQAFMACKQAIETALQRLAVQCALQAQGCGDVIHRAVRLQLPEEPLALLGIGQCQRLIARAAGNRLHVQHAVGECLHKAPQLGLLEQRFEWHIDCQCLAHARHNACRQQRVPADFKEVIRQTDLGHAQHFGPDRGHLALACGHGWHVMFLQRTSVGPWQGLAVQLAIGGQRHPLQQHQIARHHVFRQSRAQGCLELFPQRGLFLLGQRLAGDQIGKQLLMVSYHHRFAHHWLLA